jgi:hypothetical protein
VVLAVQQHHQFAPVVVVSKHLAVLVRPMERLILVEAVAAVQLVRMVLALLAPRD